MLELLDLSDEVEIYRRVRQGCTRCARMILVSKLNGIDLNNVIYADDVLLTVIPREIQELIDIIIQMCELYGFDSIYSRSTSRLLVLDSFL